MALTGRDHKFRRTPRGRYYKHRWNAHQRGIEFKLTFDEWWRIWQDSGKWALRGCRPGNWVMGRRGDVGPYAVGNVEIVPFELNHYLASVKGGRDGTPLSPEELAEAAIAF